MKKSDKKKTEAVKTYNYLKALISYKRTHIRREMDRLSELEEMLKEVER